MIIPIQPSAAVKRTCPLKFAGTSSNDACIGTQCMAWRWYGERQPATGFARLDPVFTPSTTHGYCGMVPHD